MTILTMSPAADRNAREQNESSHLIGHALVS